MYPKFARVRGAHVEEAGFFFCPSLCDVWVGMWGLRVRDFLFEIDNLIGGGGHVSSAFWRLGGLRTAFFFSSLLFFLATHLFESYPDRGRTFSTGK